MTIDPSSVLERLRAREGEMVRLLQRMVDVESPSNEAASQAPMRTLLSDELERLDFRVRPVRARSVGDHLFARRRHPSATGHQLLVGHMDTVWERGTLQTMPSRRDDERFFGPGSLDMKAGLVQLLFALRTLHELDQPWPSEPVIFVNTDEEIGSRESKTWIERLARSADRAFVLESAAGPEGALKIARKGVGRFTVTAKGTAAHAGLDPERGVSAVLEISHQIQRLFELNDPEEGVTVNVGTVDGGLRPNVIAPEATAEVDVRVPTFESARRVEQAIRELEPEQDGVRLEITGGFGRLPMERTPGNEQLWEQARRLADALGLEVEAVAVGGASDGNLTSRFTPTLDGLGGVGDGAHAHHEQVSVPHMPERAALLALLLVEPVAPTRAGEDP